MIKVILNDGAAFIGSIDRENEKEIWLDEIAAFGDVVVLDKAEIKEILNYKM